MFMEAWARGIARSGDHPPSFNLSKSKLSLRQDEKNGASIRHRYHLSVMRIQTEVFLNLKTRSSMICNSLIINGGISCSYDKQYELFSPVNKNV
jgi:hypothetical protein